MRATEIIEEIKKLPIQKRRVVIMEAISSIRKDEDELELLEAADTMAEEYRNNKELTSFTDIELDDFYEKGSSQ